MNDQLQHGTRQEGLQPGAEDHGAAESAERLAAARDHLNRLYAAADAILDDIRLGNSNSERFLEQVRQCGGQ